MSRWTMKSVVLHNLPMNMKGALKANQVKLEKANFFLLYLLDSKLFKKCLRRSSQPVCEHLFNEDKKKNKGWWPRGWFLSSKYRSTSSTSYEWYYGRTIVYNKMKITWGYFERKYLKNTKMWKIEKTRHCWRLWFKFVNNYLVLRPQIKVMAQNYVMAAIQTWEGKKINWVFIMQHIIHEEIVKTKVRVPKVVELYPTFHIMTFYHAWPTHAVVCDQPSTSQT